VAAGLQQDDSPMPVYLAMHSTAPPPGCEVANQDVHVTVRQFFEDFAASGASQASACERPAAAMGCWRFDY
jgi:hypothetical protein